MVVGAASLAKGREPVRSTAIAIPVMDTFLTAKDINMTAQSALPGPELFEHIKTTLVPSGAARTVNIGMKAASYFEPDFVQACVKDVEAAVAHARDTGQPLSAAHKMLVHLLADSAYLPNPQGSERRPCFHPA